MIKQILLLPLRAAVILAVPVVVAYAILVWLLAQASRREA